MKLSIRHLLGSRKLHVAALALGASLTVAAPAAAATGQVGSHSLTQATCFSGKRMLVQMPVVSAAYVPDAAGTFTVGGSFGGGTNRQLVGVRVWLIKWNPSTRLWHYTDQNRNGYLDRTAEFQLWTTSDGQHVDYGWWNSDANRSTAAGDMTFQIQESGLYRFNTQYFWYTNGQMTGYDLLPSEQHFVAEYFYVSKPYCTF
jgi:hypothetical protein